MTNTPSPTDEDRELIGLIALMRDVEWDDYDSCLVGVRMEDCHEAADRLESLLSDRAKLEEALERAERFIRDLATTDTIIMGDTLKAEADACRAVLNRSTDRAP